MLESTNRYSATSGAVIISVDRSPYALGFFSVVAAGGVPSIVNFEERTPEISENHANYARLARQLLPIISNVL